jgi:ribosomal protein S4E
MLNPHLLSSDKPLKVKIKQIEGNSVQLIFSDGQQFEINRKYVPKEAHVGQNLYLSLVDTEQLEIERGHVAKLVLEEILK